MCGIQSQLKCTYAEEVVEDAAWLPLEAALPLVLAEPDAEVAELPDAVAEARLPVRLSVTPYRRSGHRRQPSRVIIRGAHSPPARRRP